MRIGNHFEIDIALIRHGKTESNIKKKYISFSDEGLTDIGRLEIMDNTSHDFYPRTDLVCVSSRKRTHETASIIYPSQRPHIVPDFDEYNFGIFEGKTYDILRGDLEYKAWLDSGCTSKIMEGESRAEFVARTTLAFRDLLRDNKELENIAIVAHGGTIMAICSHFLNKDYFDFMTESGGMICCHICFDIEGTEHVSISHFSITDRNNS